jgi:hypothetical protein
VIAALKAQAGRSARWTAMPATALLAGIGTAAHSAPMAVAGAVMFAAAFAAGWSW